MSPEPKAPENPANISESAIELLASAGTLVILQADTTIKVLREAMNT